MALAISKETRSRMMAAIRGRDTKPELLVRRGLHAMGFRFRIGPRKVAGRPDLVLRKWNAAIFVHGCFWHAHAGCDYFTMPKTRASFWGEKLANNAVRDLRNIAILRAQGWRVAVVWECALRSEPEASVRALETFLTSGAEFLELAGPSSGKAPRNQLP